MQTFFKSFFFQARLCKKSVSLFDATIFLLSLVTLTLGGCGSPPAKNCDGPPQKVPRNLHAVPDAKPQVEPLSKYGNRFKNNSNTYTALKKKYTVLPTSRGYKARGLASWYGKKFHGRRTSSGEVYDMFAMTAAHRSLPLPTYAKVTNLDNGKSIIVKINDRGPFHHKRLIDLSYVAAHKLGVVGKGTARVEIESIDPRDHPRHSRRFAAKQPSLPSLPAEKMVQKSVARTEVPSSKFYLQVGAFRQKTGADELVQKLNKLSLTPKVSESKQKEASLYKVRLGPFFKDEEAIRLTQMLARAKLPNPVVIRE